MEVEIADIAISAAAGAVYAIVGYFKNKKQNEYFTDFKLTSFFGTVVLSAAIGACAKYTGMAPDAFASSAYGVVLAQFVKKLFKLR